MTDDTPRQVTPEQLSQAFAGALRVVTMGLCAMNPQIPGNVMCDAMASAMGMLLSEATKTPDVGSTLQIRERITKLVTDKVRKHVPAMDMVSPAVAPDHRQLAS